MSEQLSLIVTLPSGKKARAPLDKDLLDTLGSDHFSNQISDGWSKSRLGLDTSSLYTEDLVALEAVKRFAKIMLIYSNLRSNGFKSIGEYLQKCDARHEQQKKIVELDNLINTFLTIYFAEPDDPEVVSVNKKLAILRDNIIVVSEINLDPGFAIDGNIVLLFDYIGEHSILCDYLEYSSKIDWDSLTRLLHRYSETVYKQIYSSYLYSCYSDKPETHYENMQLCRPLTVRIYENNEVSREDLIEVLNVPSKFRPKFLKTKKWEVYEKYVADMIDKSYYNFSGSGMSFELREMKRDLQNMSSEMNRRINRRSRGGYPGCRYLDSVELQALYNTVNAKYQKLLNGY